MFYLHGECQDGTPYKERFNNYTNFLFRIHEIETDPNRKQPSMISGKTASNRLPAYMRRFLLDNGLTYKQIGQDGENINQKKQYKLEIRTDDRMPSEMGGMLSSINGWTIISINANNGPVEQLASFIHEACHLWRGDLDKGRSGQTAAEIETDSMTALTEACRYILDEYESRTQEA